MSWKDTMKKKLDNITEEVEKGNCGCGQDPCKTYGVVMVKKGKGERHFFEDGEQWTGPTHKHPDGTLMSGEKHEEGKSKILYHLYQLSDKALRHLSKDTTRIE